MKRKEVEVEAERAKAKMNTSFFFFFFHQQQLGISLFKLFLLLKPSASCAFFRLPALAFTRYWSTLEMADV